MSKMLVLCNTYLLYVLDKLHPMENYVHKIA